LEAQTVCFPNNKSCARFSSVTTNLIIIIIIIIIIVLFVHKNNFIKHDNRQHANGTDKASLALTVAPIKKERRKQQLLSLWMCSDTIY